MYKYWIYCRPKGEKRFLPSNPYTYRTDVGQMNAPRFEDVALPALKSWVDAMNALPDAVWQVRAIVGGKVVYPA